MPLILFLASLVLRIFLAKIALKVAMFAVITGLSAAFLSEITALLPADNLLNSNPIVSDALSLLPDNTGTYISLMIGALVARWTFVSSMKTLKYLIGD